MSINNNENKSNNIINSYKIFANNNNEVASIDSNQYNNENQEEAIY